MKSLALALACLLLAGSAAAAGSGNSLILKYRRGDALQLRQHADLKTPKAPAAPAATDGNATGDWLTTFSMWAEEGENGTTCQTFEPGYGWDYADPTIEYDAAGGFKPKPEDVRAVECKLCVDVTEGGEAFRQAVLRGGADAALYVHTLFAARCEDAAHASWQAAIDAVNTGDPADLAATKEFMAKFVGAANWAGVPVCMSWALVDTSTDTPVQQAEYHTGKTLD
ncbi:selenate reductase [Micractinium conductrix]|uniref:Selenate reductase n=1 Tax=Micractinium conductrix TaxID=554055 RepID=A0A2P6VRK4_9CHLO|nr:selenate reductase [Micractinium conductrix]|eukprot:PSC76728.1 selenate reductase [Micractinium conductrix]